MFQKSKSYLFLLLFIPLITTGCQKQTKYQQMINRGLASGIKKDSLFLGFNFGMTKKQFFAHAWKLNKEKLVTNGGQNMSIEYQLKELPHVAVMNFYPTFYNNHIYQMPVVVSYKGWSPWNKNLSADSLQVALVKLFKRKYGKDFFTIHNKKRGKIYVNVEGNRGISIFKGENNQMVNILFTNLSIQRKIEEKKHSWLSYWRRIQSLF